MLGQVASAQCPLLPTVALEHDRVQIQAVSARIFRQPLHLLVPQAGEKTLALSLPEAFEQVVNGVIIREASDPSNSCKATSGRSKLVCANGRAPACTESKNAVTVGTGSMALGEVRRNGGCCFTASP